MLLGVALLYESEMIVIAKAKASREYPWHSRPQFYHQSLQDTPLMSANL